MSAEGFQGLAAVLDFRPRPQTSKVPEMRSREEGGGGRGFPRFNPGWIEAHDDACLPQFSQVL